MAHGKYSGKHFSAVERRVKNVFVKARSLIGTSVCFICAGIGFQVAGLLNDLSFVTQRKIGPDRKRPGSVEPTRNRPSTCSHNAHPYPKRLARSCIARSAGRGAIKFTDGSSRVRDLPLFEYRAAPHFPRRGVWCSQCGGPGLNGWNGSDAINASRPG
ncbi:protein of unknown function (plasmid) [Cupriavidus taiwanensis]|uniref:Uncharacterized protein n=1 Tax=Cupriavidus taiwanensis TaxID=164546 RepID=A0A375EC94_9BURK|nr:protein of unknown function [Cupriavidus taiwanensis]SOZ74535.1 protein of unknown function [Cupriavidus taiwanensis]SPA03458.1 protein of unknown function [Cupriavidus taiwanensis]SPA57198.1 protein of unknown function [Cupriavidus taiwanensis]SPD48814.1 protein of unknown function [Cupriavidus taiwanensis]